MSKYLLVYLTDTCMEFVAATVSDAEGHRNTWEECLIYVHRDIVTSNISYLLI